MKNKHLLFTFMLFSLCLISCNESVGPTHLGSYDAAVKTDYDGHLTDEALQKILSKATNRLSTMESWRIQKKELTGNTKVDSSNTIIEEQKDTYGFVNGDIVKEVTDKTKKTRKGDFEFVEKSQATDYTFKYNNFYGVVSMKEENHITSVVRRNVIQPHYAGESIIAYKVANVFDDLDTDGVEAWFDTSNNLHLVLVYENTTSKRIQHSVTSDGFIATNYSKEVTDVTLTKYGDDYYDYQIASYYRFECDMQDYDKNENELGHLEATSSDETYLTFNYRENSLDVIDINTNQLVSAFSYFNGNINVTSGVNNYAATNLSSQFVDKAGQSYLYHFYVFVPFAKDCKIKFTGSGSYSFVNFNVDEEEKRTYFLDTKSNLSFDIDFAKELEQLVYEKEDEIYAKSDFSIELDLYLNIQLQATHNGTMDPIYSLNASIVEFNYQVINGGQNYED